VIGKVAKFGLFVDLPMLAVGGLVHVATISPNFARFNSFDETLSVDGVRYKVGDPVKVGIARVDFNARKLDFTLVTDAHGSRGRPGKGKKGR
jgi:ribonuclease R